VLLISALVVIKTLTSYALSSNNSSAPVASNSSQANTSIPTLTPTLTPTPIQQQITPIAYPIRQVVGATIPESELIAAINIYRQDRGLSTLNTNESLCQETRKRVQDMVNLNAGKSPDQITLNHDGMQADLDNGVLARLVGKSRYGENIAYAGCKRPADGVTVDVTTGVQLVEWCFDSSPLHKETLLEPYWTDVCSSGQFPYYVETFAK
jgi:uncharacterized protein YkwD